MLENLKEMVQSYAALAQKSSDQKYLSKYADVYGEMYEIMLNTSAEDVKVEVDGKEYSGRRYAGKMNGESLAALLNYMQNCEIDELANMMNGLLELVSLTGDQEYESYDDLLADAGAAIDADVELTVVLNGKLNYQKMVMQQEGVNGMAVQSDMESVTDKKGTRVTMIQTMGDPQTNGTVQNISCELTGPVNAPEALHFDMDYESVTDASDDDYQYVTTMTMAMDGAQTDGLWNVTADANVAMDITYGEAGEEEQYSSEIGINADYAETAEEDGGVNGAFTLSIDDGAEDYGLSFELCRRKDAVIEALVEEDTELSELSADMTDAVYTQLGADAMAFVADAAELTADESVAALVELFTPNYEEAADAYDEEELEDEVSQQVGSIEEAAAIYASEIPEYTAPEGYELSVVNVTSTDMEAIYTNGESEFTFYLLDFGADMGMEPEITYGDDNEGGVFYAEVMLGSSYISFSFENGTTRAEAEAITAGLNL